MTITSRKKSPEVSNSEAGVRRDLLSARTHALRAGLHCWCLVCWCQSNLFSVLCC
uniref:Uncharacterized protein n=1 Tax=Anguilla anguilla TaxID=7936 RepID=A0A0E9WIY7_ANGAN